MGLRLLQEKWQSRVDSKIIYGKGATRQAYFI
jgi:hypothetical protein